jgi:hypothetical protein
MKRRWRFTPSPFPPIALNYQALDASEAFAVRNVASAFGHYSLRYGVERATSRVRVALLRKAHCLSAGESLLASCGVGIVLSMLQVDASAFKEELCESFNQVGAKSGCFMRAAPFLFIIMYALMF